MLYIKKRGAQTSHETQYKLLFLTMREMSIKCKHTGLLQVEVSVCGRDDNYVLVCLLSVADMMGLQYIVPSMCDDGGV